MAKNDWRFIKLILLCSIVIFDSQCNGIPVETPKHSDLFELSIIHISDFQARFEETDNESGICYRKIGKECIGGLSRISTLSQILKKRPNSIFLNAGDNFAGTIWNNIHGWNVTAQFLTMLPLDVMNIGNREFENGIEGLVSFVKAIKPKIPVVVSNIDATNEPTLQGLMENSTIIVRGGRKIGVIGIILRSSPRYAPTGKLVFFDEVETVNLEAAKLRDEHGVNIIIVLSHSGYRVDLRMAEKCPLVDIIVGGHTRTFLYTGEPPRHYDHPRETYPSVVKQRETNRTVLIVHAGGFSKYLGNLSVWFDEHGKVQNWVGNPIRLDETIEEDKNMLKALEPWKADVDKVGKEVVGRSLVELRNDCRRGECNIGNMITDAMIESYIDRAENESYWTYAAISAMSTNSIRTSIKTFNGSITYSELLMAQPFGNTWDAIEIQGRVIRQILKDSLHRTEVTSYLGPYYLYFVWSGLKVVYKISDDFHTEVADVKIRCRKCQIPKYEDLIDDEWYRLVVQSFLLEKEQVFNMRYRNHEIGDVDIVLLKKFVKNMSPIYGKESRIKIIDAPLKTYYDL